jgi:hypothetical protein
VAALREVIQFDAIPALALLDDARPSVRVAALSALVYRKHWQPSHAEVVKLMAERAIEPEIRAAAIRALAYTRDRSQVETLAQFLRDRSPLVRRAAADVLFWESERRWSWIRFGVHEALADPSLREEGALPLAGATLPPQALADLMDWAGEGGALSVRSSATLAAYYGHALSAAPENELTHEILSKVLDPAAPTVLRLELAQLLLEHRLFGGTLISRFPCACWLPMQFWPPARIVPPPRPCTKSLDDRIAKSPSPSPKLCNGGSKPTWAYALRSQRSIAAKQPKSREESWNGLSPSHQDQIFWFQVRTPRRPLLRARNGVCRCLPPARLDREQRNPPRRFILHAARFGIGGARPRRR